MLIFKCPECDDSKMGFNEATEMWACADCDHEIELAEATEMFDAGDLIGVIETDELDEEFPPKKKDKKDDDDDDDDKDDDDKDDKDTKKESFNDFSNRATWTANLITQNEYKVHKAVLAGISEAESDETKEDSAKAILTDFSKTAEYAPAFENLDLDDIAWDEIVESVSDTAAEFDEIRADLTAALGVNEGISDEERTSILQVFESALTVKYNELKGNLEEKFDVNLEDAKNENYKLLTKEASGYFDEAIQEWMEENKLAIESAIQTEQTNSFMTALKGVFEDHYIEVPEGRFDILEDMATKVEKQDEELEASKAREADLQGQIDESVKTRVLMTISEDLTDTQVEKLEELAGSIDYESETQFEAAVTNLRDSFMKPATNRKDTDVIDSSGTTDLNEAHDETPVDYSDPIAVAAAAMNRRT